MQATRLKTDYLIAGAGAVGMAFADTLLSETDATITIVDRHAKPGGHWNVAYPFVTLHQPSTFYGVNSKELSRGVKDATGLNAGLGDLASGAEVAAYFDDVMRNTFLPSGRVRYFPMCDFDGDKAFTSRLTGERWEIEITRKLVDATYLKTSTPSMHTPAFEIAEGARVVPPNDLMHISEKPDGFVVMGAGKTAIDTCLWLLAQGIEPDNIRWIKPRDGWLLDRENAQTDPAFFKSSIGSQALQFEAIAASTSREDMFDRLEASGYFLRIDPNTRPTMFHAATVSRAEIDELRRITQRVRMGRVRAVGTTEISLEHGTIPTTPKTLHIDCTASAITNLEMRPVFEGERITPQTVRPYQPVFSAAFIAHVEATKPEEDKNRTCNVIPLPNKADDYIPLTIQFMMNQFNWGQDPELRAWLKASRLDGFAKLVSGIPEEDSEKRAIIGRIKAASMPAMAKLQQYNAELKAKGERHA
ncbi:NAD(P)-binding protein [Pontivivens insulae]|uniref:Uncharacterized protein n=1 Tax=Pontivivens insulae TaxID=1639689 RepID=A0A2R8AFK3_9RHOB|nr:NAD(P)-binding protein [Pontivivens insulae]RED12242.1 hypothetical protein DFR53_2958 [Pontivivens insulae]SPF30999.1 hypothetical protein POI8812_03346 [Pontivivens insulae]